jgi:hypothetical protein
MTYHFSPTTVPMISLIGEASGAMLHPHLWQGGRD